jgi:hypothetical protein
MSLARRLDAAEARLAVPVTSGRGAWLAFRSLTTRTLTPFPEALAAARAACRQTPRDWSSDQGARQSFLKLVEAVERALRDFPEADAAMEAAFNDVDVAAEVRATIEQLRREEEAREAALPPMPTPGHPCWEGWSAFCARMEAAGFPPDDGADKGPPRPARPGGPSAS